jgi:hypothetical protein
VLEGVSDGDVGLAGLGMPRACTCQEQLSIDKPEFRACDPCRVVLASLML